MFFIYNKELITILIRNPQEGDYTMSHINLTK